MGKSINELLGIDLSMTHRQYLAWQEWLAEQWNETDRLCDYVRQLSFDIRRAHAKDPKQVKFEDTKISYKTRQPVQTGNLSEEQKQQRMANSRAVWGAYLGVGVRKAKAQRKEVRP